MSEKTLAISSLRRDGGTQPRAAISEEIAQEYAELVASGAKFPPIVAFYDGSDYWLADGFHRCLGYEAAGRSKIEVEVRQGTQRDAVLFSCGANAVHGLRRTNRDKRRAVLCLLEDEEWSQWSDREIARRCAVTHFTVGQLRSSLEDSSSEGQGDAPRTYTRKGKRRKMKTGKIGKGKKRSQQQPDGDAAVDTQRAFTVIEALEKLAGFDISAEVFAAELPPYLRDLVSKNLEPAYAWLSDLYARWEVK